MKASSIPECKKIRRSNSIQNEPHQRNLIPEGKKIGRISVRNEEPQHNKKYNQEKDNKFPG